MTPGRFPTSKTMPIYLSQTVAVRCIALALIFLLGMALTPEPTMGASHGGIRVMSAQQEIQFPDQIIFSLSAESTYDIVDVRLHYRNANFGPSTYAYAEFNPGTSVLAEFRLSTRGSGYLPPGTQIEYYYTFKDIQGNQHQTAPLTFEYTDNRFQWETTPVGPLTLLHHDIPQSRVDAVAGELESELGRIGGLLQLEPDQPVKGFIYNSFDEASAAFPQQSRTITEEEVFHGFAFSSSNVFLGIGLDPGLLTHESAHLLLDRALGDASDAAPSWLTEGFASYVEPEPNTYSGQSLSPRGQPLRRMSGVSGTPESIYMFYEKSESVVAYLIERHGPSSFRQFIRELSNGSDTDTALLNTYRFDQDGLDARWANSSDGLSLPTSGRPRANPPSPILFLNSWLLGGLFLVVMIVMSVRYIWNRLHPVENWDDDDW